MVEDEKGVASGAFEIGQDEVRRGTGAAPGIGIGRVYVVDRRRVKVPKQRVETEDEIENEIERFHRAIDRSHRQLERIKEKIAASEQDHYNIITAHQLILHDEHLVDQTIAHIREKQINAEWALRKTVEHIKSVFDSVEDDYFRERRSDIEFVGERVLRNLLGREDQTVSPPPDAIVAAHDLSPADTAQLYKARVAGLVTDAGGKTSHTAIMARAHEIPAVVGLENITQLLSADDLVIVDGTRGLVVLRPSAQTVAEYRERSRREAAADAALLSNRQLPAETLDGVSATLMANIDHPDELESAIEHGALGVGLFRTEYMYMDLDGGEPPGEEEHYTQSCALLVPFEDRPVTFRTMDFGADKIARILELEQAQHAEANPALGLRSVRLCLTKEMMPLFRSQLRGILRASAHGNARLMFPMVSGVSELRSVREILAEVMDELRKEGSAFDENIPVGIMIEMPSAVMVADHLAREVDFFSIGTNDLIQYTLAVDRVNEQVAYLYDPMHPGLLRLIDTVVRAARGAGIDVSICGEMAGDPEVAPLLVGLGLHALSMNAVAIPQVKRVIRQCSAKALEELARRALQMPTGADVRHAVRDHLREVLASRAEPVK